MAVKPAVAPGADRPASAAVRTTPWRGLSGRLLWLTVLLVLLGEVLIYVPSISRFRMQYLTERVAKAHLATAVLLTGEQAELDAGLEARLLDQAGLLAVEVMTGDRMLKLGAMRPVDATYPLADETVPEMILNAFRALLGGGDRVIRVIAPSPQDPDVIVDLVMEERPMCAAMAAYSGRIVQLSLFLSLLVAGSLFLLLQSLIVAPLRQLTERLTAFRDDPENPDALQPATPRRDELGVVERETRRMQLGVRSALRQHERLAALGAAVGKINHDLRNVLASAILVSDRLEASADPDVRRVAPRLIAALERAAALCAETLAFARSDPPELAREAVPLAPFVAAAAERTPGFDDRWHLRLDVAPSLTAYADPDQRARVVDNLLVNAAEAMGEAGGLIVVEARRVGRRLSVRFVDTGPGVPAQVQDRLFEAFVGTGRKGGTGLGLHIARDVARRHGGDLVLERTGPDGTTFRLDLPNR